MKKIKVIVTGVTGMVGEGVLFACLQSNEVIEVLMINRRPYDLTHPKLKELIVPDFFKMNNYLDSVQGYDACFFCAGISSIGMSEEKYRLITYDTTLSFAKSLVSVNEQMIFTYVSGSHTDSTEKGRLMWARVKGKTENDLTKLPFKAVYNFRPGVLVPYDDQKNWKWIFKVMVKALKVIAPKSVLTLQQLGNAMINVVTKSYQKSVLEIADIKKAAAL